MGTKALHCRYRSLCLGPLSHKTSGTPDLMIPTLHLEYGRGLDRKNARNNPFPEEQREEEFSCFHF